MEYVDLAKYKFVVEPRYYFYGWASSPRILARQSLAQALVKARLLLPRGCNFKIWDCKRSRKTNLEMVKSFRKRLRLTYLKASPKRIKKILIKFCGRIPCPVKEKRLDTHRNGGAVDLTIVDRKDNELYMGTDFDDLTPKATTDFFEKKKLLTATEKIARKNRWLLKRVMIKAGFKNYAPEWWHWSFDR